MTAAIEGVSGQQHASAALYSRERPGNHFTGGWVGLRAGLDWREISSPPGFFCFLNIHYIMSLNKYNFNTPSYGYNTFLDAN